MSLVNSDYILDHAPCGFLSFTLDGIIVQINHTLLKWLNLEREAVLLRKQFKDIISRGAFLYHQMYVSPLLTMQGFVNEISIDLVTSNDSRISCLLNASVMKDDEGSVQLINATLFNISDRKKYELEIFKAKTFAEEEKKRFEFLANSLPSILWTAAPSGKINFLNDRFYEYFDLRPEETSAFSLKNVLYSSDFRAAAEAWIYAVQEEKDVQLEARLKNSADEYRWFFIRIVPWKDHAGMLSMWLCTCVDIHAQKEKQLQVVNSLNSQLSEVSSIAQHKEKVLKELAFAQSHLVRSPISKILGLISLLESREADDETRFIVSLLSQSTSELDSIVTDIVKRTHTDKAVY